MSDRRNFFKRAGRGAALGLTALAGGMSAREFLRKREREFRRQWSVMSGLNRDPAVLEQYSRDYGRLCYQRPLAVVYPESVKDIQELIYYCNEHEVPLNTRGLGHAQNGQSLISGGIILDLKPVLNRTELVGEEAVVEAGASWLAVQESLRKQGRGLRVCPDFMAITVGGSVSVGGIGARAMRAGTVGDNVLELELVTGKGEVVHCSAAQAEDLFRFTRFGLGQLAVITKVRLRTMDYRPRTLVAVLRFASFPEFVQRLHRLLTQSEDWLGDLFVAEHIRSSYWNSIRLGHDELGETLELEKFRKWVLTLGGKTDFTWMTDYEFTMHRNVQQELKYLLNYYHLWIDFFQTPDLFLQFNRELGELFSQPEHEALRPWIATYHILYPAGSALEIPLAAFPRTQGRWVISTGVYFSIPPSRPELVEPAKELIARLIAKYVPLGSGLYLYGWYRLSAAQRRQLWGQALEDYFRIKSLTDPKRIINPAGIINSLLT